MTESYDAIVVGAGHNGLVCAAYLVRTGRKVCVLERSDRLGGACVTEEPWPGFRISTGAYSVSLLLPQIVSDLGLDLDVRAKDPAVFAPLEDGGGLLLWRDGAKRKEAIARLSSADADAYPKFVELFEEAARRLRPMLTYPATRKQIRRAFRQSEIDKLFPKTVDGSIAALCEEYFETPLIQGILASQGIVGSAAGPRTPGTAYIYLHHAWGQAAGEPGAWGFVRGGMGAITEALADVVRSGGGEIRLESEVREVKFDKHRRASGVVLASGEEVDSSVVCSNADPKRTAQFVSEEKLSPEFVEDVELLPTFGTVVKVNCALGGLPKFKGMEGGDPGPEHLGTITIAPSIDYLEEAAKAAGEGRPAEGMFCEASIQSASETGLAPEGKHTLSILAQHAPYELADGDWEKRREEIGDLVVASIERYAPGLSDLIENRMVLGPPDLEERFGLTGGQIFHGEMLPDWLFDKRPALKWHRHRTPVAGLYLCGAGAHPGGGVTGAPGRSAARAVLTDFAHKGVSLEPAAAEA